MKLIDILVRDLPNLGGWPFGVYGIEQSSDGYLLDSVDMTMDCLFDRRLFNLASDWNDTVVNVGQYEAALAASKPEWDGKGLPPVGCECEYETKFDGWQPVRIELIKSEGIAFTWLANSQAYNGLDCVGVQKSGSFRPIRSEADKKKEAAIFAIADLCRESASNGHSAELIYDAIKSGKIVID